MKKTILISLIVVLLVFGSTAQASRLGFTEEQYEYMMLENEKLRREYKNIEKDYAALQEKNQELQREIDQLKKLMGKDIAKEIPVLLYHHILPQEDMDKYGWNGNDSVISLENFREQMKYLKDNDFHTANLDELEAFIKGEQILPKNTVVITFDDGYLSNIVHAYPIMKEYGFNGIIFIIGDSENREKEEYDPATTQRIYLPEAKNYSDVFEYGCHSYGFHFLENGHTMLEVLDKEAIKTDLKRSKALLGARAIAYPFGRYSEAALQAVEELNYILGFTVEQEYVKPGDSPYELPRFIINPQMGIEGFIQIISR